VLQVPTHRRVLPVVGRFHVRGDVVAPRDEVDEDADDRKEEHEQQPQRLRPPAEIVAPEHVREHEDDGPDPGEQQEEQDHRPEDVQDRVVGSQHHNASLERCPQCPPLAKAPTSPGEGGLNPSARLRYLMATGFSGDPAPVTTGSGSAAKNTSYMWSTAQ